MYYLFNFIMASLIAALGLSMMYDTVERIMKNYSKKK